MNSSEKGGTGDEKRIEGMVFPVLIAIGGLLLFSGIL